MTLKTVPISGLRTVPGQWCGECGLIACYFDDYLCSVCREMMETHGDPGHGRELTRSL